MWREKYIGLIGIGAMYSWACAIMLWVDWVKSDHFGSKVIGAIGSALVSASMIAVFLYIGRKEEQRSALEQQLEFYKQRADHWESQAQSAIAVLEKERLR